MIQNVAAAEEKVNILKEDLLQVMFEASRLREMISTLKELIRFKINIHLPVGIPALLALLDHTTG